MDMLTQRRILTSSMAQACTGEVAWGNKVNTSQHLSKEQLDCLGRLARNIDMLEAQRPNQLANEFEHVERDEGKVLVRNSRFNNRVRPSRQVSRSLACRRSNSFNILTCI